MARIKHNLTVSIIIPTYNRAPLIGRAIHSVLNQTHQDFELIVVDDGSTDDTEEVVRSFNDERLGYIRLKQNSRTPAVPRNTGIKAARGEYIAFLDSDDEWRLQKLEKQVKAFEEASPKVGTVYTGMWWITENEKTYLPSADIIERGDNIHKALLKGNFVWGSVALIKKECFNRAGMFDEKLSYGEDADMWLRVSKYYDFKLIDEPLVIAYCTSSGMSANPILVSRGVILFLEKHFQEFKKDDKRLLAQRYFNAGAALCINDDLTQFAEGRRCLRKAAKICPLNLEYILVGLISLCGPALFHNRPLRKLYRQFKKSFLRIVLRPFSIGL